jgi:hypothetical protein
LLHCPVVSPQEEFKLLGGFYRFFGIAYPYSSPDPLVENRKRSGAPFITSLVATLAWTKPALLTETADRSPPKRFAERSILFVGRRKFID